MREWVVMPRTVRTRELLAALAVLGLATGLTACGASHTTAAVPKTVVKLSNDVASGTLPTTTVTLGTGQSFAVERLVSPLPKQWKQTSAGDPGVLAKGASVVASPCPKEQAGCATPTDAVYTAKARGTTTVVWTFAPVTRCAPATSSACARVTKTIRVIVR
jgi:hypothetical protein